MPTSLPPGWTRVLHPGVDYSTWPQLKVMRARQLSAELFARIDLDAHTRPRLLRPEIATDRRTVTFFSRGVTGYPIDEWSLLLGDALHNYRSALDALAWEVAHLDGAAPNEGQSRRIYFPICLTEADWSRAASSYLSTVPPEILDRIRRVQPFVVPPAEEGIAVVLHDLDIADKHRGLLRARLSPGDPQTLVYALFDDRGQRIERHDYEILDPPSSLENGYPIFRLTTKRSISFAEAPMGVPVSLDVEWRGRNLDVMSIMDLVDRQVTATLEMVNTGDVELG